MAASWVAISPTAATTGASAAGAGGPGLGRSAWPAAPGTSWAEAEADARAQALEALDVGGRAEQLGLEDDAQPGELRLEAAVEVEGRVGDVDVLHVDRQAGALGLAVGRQSANPAFAEGGVDVVTEVARLERERDVGPPGGPCGGVQGGLEGGLGLVRSRHVLAQDVQGGPNAPGRPQVVGDAQGVVQGGPGQVSASEG